MANQKLGDLIKQARTNAGLTQEKLAKAVGGITANDISKAERGDSELTQEQLKKIAKATGVTQASLINASKGTTAKKSTTTTKSTTAAKSTTAKTTAAARKTTAKTTTDTKKTTAKTTAKTTKTASTASTTSMKVTASEKKLLEAFRDASSDQKKAALYILKGESDDLVDDIIRKHSKDDSPDLGDFLQNVLGGLIKK